MVLYQWSARKIRPIVLLYVAAVFGVMMAVSYFLIHSLASVKALALGAIAFIVPLIPSVMSKNEYRLTASGLDKRPLKRKDPQDFKEVFRWDQLSHVVPISHGFKYYKPVDGSHRVRRFWKTHISDSYSGEFHAEAADRDEVLRILASRGIPTSRP